MSNIDQSFRNLRDVLVHREQELLEEVSRLKQEKLGRLQLQKQELETQIFEFQGRVADKKSLIENATGNSSAAVEDQVLRWMTDYQEQCVDLDPVEEADMMLETNVSPELIEVCKKIKITTNPVDPDKCIVDGFNGQPKVIEVKKPFSVKLHTLSLTGTPQQKPVNVEVRLTSLIDDSVVGAKITKNNGNTYDIECTPQVRGQHRMAIAVNGLVVAKSPFSVIVKITPTELSRPVRIINDLRGPTGIAFNSANELVVAEFNGGVVVLDRDGNRVRSIERHGPNYDLEEPWGVAIDADDNIYLTDQDNGKVYKFDKDLQVVNHSVIKGAAKCFGVAIVGERVMVMKRNSKQLEVFTKDLKFVREIEVDIRGCAIAFDGHSKLYICDSLTHCIQVLNDQCEYLYSIGNKPGLGLRIPHFVCVDGDLVYLTEYEGHCVSVFTKDGEYVTSFGSLGSGEGQFDHPYGIAVDMHGFLYVADRVNNRVLVF